MTRSVLIVGASSGIGFATALHLSKAGDRLMLVSRDADALEQVAARCLAAGAAQVRTTVADVLDDAQVRGAVDATVAAFDRLDAVVHTATVMAYGTVEEVPADVFTTVVDTAVHGTLHLARAVLPVFRRQRGGTLVVVNSLLGSVTVPNMGAYAVSKWGQRALVRTLQQEVRGESGIHVCMVSPGSINTPIYYQAANYTGKAARPPIPVLQPDRAGAAVAGLLDKPRNHVSVPVGPGNPVIISGFRLVPWIYDRVVGPMFRLAALTRADLAPTEGNVHHADGELEAMHGHWPDVAGEDTEIVGDGETSVQPGPVRS